MNVMWYFVRKLYANAGLALYANIAGMIVAGLLEGIGVLLLVPMLSMSGMLDMDAGSIPVIGRLDLAFGQSQGVNLTIVLCIYVLLVMGQGYLKRSLAIGNAKIHQAFMRHLRLDTFGALIRANWEFHVAKRKSDFVNTLTSEIARVSGAMNMLLQMAASLLFTLIQLALAFWLSAELAAFVLVCGLGVALLSRRFVRQSKDAGQQSTNLSKTYFAGLMDQLSGIKDIKSNSLEQSRMTWMASLEGQMQQEQLKHVKIKSTSQFVYQAAAGLLIAAFLLFAVLVLKAGTEQLLLIIVIFSRLWPRFGGIQSNLESLFAAIPAFHSVRQTQLECREAAEFLAEDFPGQGGKPVVIRHMLECRGVSFRYNRQEPNYALKDIHLQIPAKRMTALIGRSGAGKSTLVDLIMGLVTPERGEVLIDGAPLGGDLLKSFRKSISYVPQDPFLFNASIRENLLLISEEASEEEIWEALEFSASADFVRQLPLGLDTVVGDRGVRLSGGERQRLVLARAILRNPSVLILDEATSALDTENERNIQEALERLNGKMTIVVIAHRLSTIRNADQVIVLDEGGIVQRGIFSQLANEKKGLLSHMLDQQAISVSN